MCCFKHSTLSRSFQLQRKGKRTGRISTGKSDRVLGTFMKTASLYADAQVNACFSVIVELMTYLKKYGSHIVLVGGWVPYFLYSEINEKSKKHVGSLDVDLALKFILIPEQEGITQKTVIECDGDFFHMNPDKFSAEDKIFKKGMTASEKWEIDELRTKQLIEKGFRVIRLWENEINKMELTSFNKQLMEIRF